MPQINNCPPTAHQDGLVKLALTMWESRQGDLCAAHTCYTRAALLPRAQLHPVNASHWFVQPMSVENMNLLSIHLVLTPLLDERAEESQVPRSL